jgi:hypothetical protein
MCDVGWPDTERVRYLKLAIGVIVAIAGLALTVGAVGDMVYYVTTCPSGNEIGRHLCSDGLREILFLLPAAALFDVLAVVIIRNRDRSTLIRQEASIR